MKRQWISCSCFRKKAEGRRDGIGNFRVGYSLYYLNREAEAAEYFQRAVAFGDDGEDTQFMLKRSIFEAKMKALLMEGVKLLEAGEWNIEKIQEKFGEIMTGMNLPAASRGVSCKRYRIDEVRSVRKLFNRGVYYHAL